ncbi:hypothetical protein ACSCBZ_24865 [Streptomyces niveiscabiei]|uniref:hypothetical protein n=1 Tax=Streptomyces niveiscabiei TaxID=164115 RepID=UPI0006EB4680|nr:hypothetical protein [Streptomyces niveiscabiei]
MPQTAQTPGLLQRIARLESEVAALRRAGWERDEMPFYPTSLHGVAYEDATAFTTLWEGILSPRTASLALGLVFIGDQVGATNSGGAWQVLFNDTTVVASGSVPATFSFSFPAVVLDLTPYRAMQQLKVQIEVRRTSGATTGGKFGGGGCIGGAPTYARLI